MSTLPWVRSFLDPIRDEYAQPPPDHRQSEPTAQEIDYIVAQAKENDPFDTLHLKKDMVTAYFNNKASILKSSCVHGSIFIVSLHTSPFRPSWNTWWRAVRLLNPCKQVRIVIFGHPKERDLPSLGMPLAAEHVNGGAAFRCDPYSIVLYRKQEATRVLIHELLHATCSDPYHKDTPFIEADTEAWAELILCAMAARGKTEEWMRRMNQQMKWSVKQAATVKLQYNVCSPKDYAWRYLVGRLDVWKRLGLVVPAIPEKFSAVKSLRFTVCEPEDI
jgi:hypothetical protein